MITAGSGRSWSLKASSSAALDWVSCNRNSIHHLVKRNNKERSTVQLGNLLSEQEQLHCFLEEERLQSSERNPSVVIFDLSNHRTVLWLFNGNKERTTCILNVDLVQSLAAQFVNHCFNVGSEKYLMMITMNDVTVLT